ncbi:MAG: hypothetical protein K8S97_04120 [Anaerolineae bacterium]|nr:hypothetical protein [Anaerolineae bacterium]
MKRIQPIRRWLLISVLIVTCLLIIHYILPLIGNEQKAAEKRFQEVQHDLVSVTVDPLVFESNPSGDVVVGDGKIIHEDCFTGDTEQVFGTDRSFDEVITSYAAKLHTLGLESSPRNAVEFERTPDERILYNFGGPDTFVVVYRLIPHRDDMGQWGIYSINYSTYYVVGVLFKYPSRTRCTLMGY